MYCVHTPQPRGPSLLSPSSCPAPDTSSPPPAHQHREENPHPPPHFPPRAIFSLVSSGKNMRVLPPSPHPCVPLWARWLPAVPALPALGPRQPPAGLCRGAGPRSDNPRTGGMRSGHNPYEPPENPHTQRGETSPLPE